VVDNTPMSQKNLKVDANNDQRRLDNYLIYKFPNLPKSKIYSMIRKGEIRINSKRCKAQTKISLGDEIRLPPYLESEKRDNNFKNLPPKIEKLIKNAIIFDDDDFIVINKPEGISVHGGSGQKFSLIDGVRSIYSSNDIDLCHRLDKETSGCIVLSKNKLFLKHFNDLLRTKKITKTYLAIICGKLKKSITVTDKLIARRRNNIKTSLVDDSGKEALSIFNPIKIYKNYTLVEIEILTGKLHQIRAHAESIKHPVLGDFKYGNIKLFKEFYRLHPTFKRLALHSQSIAFLNIDNQQHLFVADLSDDFQRVTKIFS
jgi:23S rRNA pseudouridine955/2504/2580 synthase